MNVLVFKLGEDAPSGPLLWGAGSGGVRVGVTRLAPGEEVGPHSTEQNEEVLVFLAGRGVIVAGGREHDVGLGCVAYIGPGTEHDVLNTGQEELVYVFVVAQAHRDAIERSSGPCSGQANR